MKPLYFLIVTFLACIFSAPASAIDLRLSGTTLYLSGLIKPGDEYKFRDFIEGKQINYINLKSSGGQIRVAGDIGRQIRSKSITTVVDASNNFCRSACTIIFAAGKQRIYSNAEKIKDGVTKLKGTGLAYHEANNWLRDGRRGQSGAGTAEVINWYYEFGTPNAAKLVTKAGWKEYYYISSSTAKALGIATSTQIKQ